MTNHEQKKAGMLSRLAWLLEPAHLAITRWILRSGLGLQCSDALNMDGINAAARVTCAAGVNVDSDGSAMVPAWLAMRPRVSATGDAAPTAPELAATAVMLWALMVSDLAGELQPPEPSNLGPSRTFDRKSPDGPYVPAHALRWHDNSTAASGRKRTPGFR